MLRLLIVVLLTLVSVETFSQTYKLGSDSQRQPGVPEGVLIELNLESQIYENTERECWIYVPAQYDGNTPAAIMIFQDGEDYMDPDGLVRVPNVIDNLIYKGELPLIIAVFINPGRFIGDNPEGPARNRSFEYDSMTDLYSRFLLEEIIPEVQKDYRITEDRAGWAICGMDSGAICAFTAAWHRSDKFSKVVSHVGSFTNIRGGHHYPTLIRQNSTKPIRVFMQSGANGLDSPHGNWWLANKQMVSALKYAGYDYNKVWGNGGHDLGHAGMIFPDTMKWLWHDYLVSP